MRRTIQNEYLTLTVDTLGAQMLSLQGADGTEYLWKGDPDTWTDHAPVLFPWIARLMNDSYRVQEQLYHMGIHGFAAASEFETEVYTDTVLTLVLHSNTETKLQYPFDFELRITYALTGNRVQVTYWVENQSAETMAFGIGGHPGFRVPLEAGETFEDYFLEFGCRCQPDRIGFTEQLLLSGVDTPYVLEDGKILPLRHSLFDDDAVILKDMARSVTLRSRKSSRSVQVSFPDFPYFGIWHWPNSEARYVCLEPWSSLPARQDVVEELTCKSDLIHLKPKTAWKTIWTISVT